MIISKKYSDESSAGWFMIVDWWFDMISKIIFSPMILLCYGLSLNEYFRVLYCCINFSATVISHIFKMPLGQWKFSVYQWVGLFLQFLQFVPIQGFWAGYNRVEDKYI